MKKLLAILLTLSMLASFVVLPTFADEAAENATEDNATAENATSDNATAEKIMGNCFFLQIIISFILTININKESIYTFY